MTQPPNHLTRLLDTNSRFFGVSEEKLMENAGRAAFEILRKKFNLNRQTRVQIFCGPGGNGGDGFVLGKYLLQSGVPTEIILALPKEQIKSSATRQHFSALPVSAVKKFTTPILFHGNILVDALLGVGASGKLREPFASIVRKFNAARGKKISLDVPTPGVRSSLSIAFHYAKKSSAPKKTIVAPIGLPPLAEEAFGPGDFQSFWPERKTKSHKGENGRLAIIGGSAEYFGAPIFSAQAAANLGCDLVHLFVPEVNFASAREVSLDFLAHALPEPKNNSGQFLARKIGNGIRLTPAHALALIKFINTHADGCVLGPGLGNNSETREAVKMILQKIKVPTVVDADAILPHAEYYNLPKTTIFTPHAGEFMRLTGEELRPHPSARTAQIQRWARKLNVTILLKSAEDMIAAPDGRVKKNVTGNAGLTIGGTGDILVGTVGFFLGRGLDQFLSAGLAAFLVGFAGDELQKRQKVFSATEVLFELAPSVKKILEF